MKPDVVQAVAAIGQFVMAIVLGGLTAVYVRLTRQMVVSARNQAREQTRGAQAALLNQLITEYGSSQMGDAIRQVIDWRNRHGLDRFAEAFERELDTPTPLTTEAGRLDRDARRPLSAFFFRLRVLCENGLLEPRLLASSLGLGPIKLFLQVIDPLDQAVRRAHHLRTSEKAGDFFRTFLAEQRLEE
jgi:hypothetical protein